jgi:hypothetical protein
MHEQVGDSLSESEREVVVAIEQIDTLNARTGQQREHIRTICEERWRTDEKHPD